jgi:hypothetical protein
MLAASALCLGACSHDDSPKAVAAASSASATPPASGAASAPGANAAPAAQQFDPSDVAPPASQTGGFDGAAAYDYTAKLVAFGPRPAGSDAIHKTQDYLIETLKGFGCAVDADDFHASTPVGSLAMKNVVAKVPGEGKGIILLLTHYDTVNVPNFVGAEDGGSSTGLMLEMAKVLCAGKKGPNAVWLAFLDGEEAQVDWNKNNDNTYGSRQMAAQLAISGDLKRVKAVILADMIAQKNAHFDRDSNSTPWLVDILWKTAARLGYKDVFVSEQSGIEDDHLAFTHRDVPSVDIIDLTDYQNEGFWHTAQDTMDKLSPRMLAVTGHVILESMNELQKKFH